MKPLKISISGVRGIIGETFTPELAVGFAQAFATYLGPGRVLVCRDTRPSGPMVHAAVISGLLAAGSEVIDLGICPTPSLQLAVTHLKAQGGVSISAGHNPLVWNALKFVRYDGLYLSPLQAEELLDIYHQAEFDKASWDHIHTQVSRQEAISHHIEILKGAFDLTSIRERHFKVAVDCCNGSCSLLSPVWFEALGCEVLAINDDPALPFPHVPEPSPSTMAQLRAVVKAGKADLGFAHDADGERLGIVSERAEPLSEEMTLALATQIRLKQKRGPVVTNICTSHSIDTIADRHNAPVVRTPVGQAYISEAMLEHQAVLGGEGSGGVAVPEVHATHDSAAAIGLILEHLAHSGEKLSYLAECLPRYAMLKHNLPVSPNRIYSVLQQLRNEAMSGTEYRPDLTDGIKLFWPEGWVHVRASNTESIIRVIAEADTLERARNLLDWARDRIKN